MPETSTTWVVITAVKDRKQQLNNPVNPSKHASARIPAETSREWISSKNKSQSGSYFLYFFFPRPNLTHCFELTEIFLPLSHECWIKDIIHHAQPNYVFTPVCVWERETDRHRERDRERKRHRETESQDSIIQFLPFSLFLWQGLVPWPGVLPPHLS